MQEYWNTVFKAVTRPRWFFVMRPEAAMAHAAMPRHQRELNVWRMALALQIDMVDAIKSGALTRDAPLDLLQSITRRCAACHRTDECLALLVQSGDQMQTAPEFCRVNNRLMALASRGEGQPARQDRAS